MPLDKSGSKASVSNNIRAEMAAGKPHDQAIAIALSVARRARAKKAEGGPADNMESISGIVDLAAKAGKNFDWSKFTRSNNVEDQTEFGALADADDAARMLNKNMQEISPAQWARLRELSNQIEDHNIISSFMPPERPIAPFLGRAAGIPDINKLIERNAAMANDSIANTARKYAGGGEVSWSARQSARGIGKNNAGYLGSTVPGRTDKLPIDVPSGAYVVPADVVSGLGQGNSNAGAAVLGRMFGKGPKIGMSSRLRAGRPSKGSKSKVMATGGAAPDVPIMAAGGEFVIHPDQVFDLGNGDLDKGHAKLDAFVLQLRKKTINEMRKLKPPVKN